VYEPGAVLAGKYRIERELGRGGMGLVLAAEHIELRTTVAVKCLHPVYAGRDDVVKRFLREARASARLTSEHACRVFDVGRLDTGVPYFVMELLHGSDLANVLRTSGALDVATATSYVQQACDAIQEAHAARIIHRDLKPGNLFVTQRRDGSPLIKVLDFGVAKAPEDGDFTLTTADAIVGSPAYMAPEQIRASKIADERSDIWSLGVILYELVSGKQPFESASIGDLAIRIATEPLEPLHGLPLGFTMTVARCLEKDPAHRFQRVEDLARALAACTAPGTAPVLPAAPGHPASPPETLATYPAPAHGAAVNAPVSTTLRGASGAIAAAQRPFRSRRALIIAGVATILIGAGFAILLGSPSSSDGHSQTHLRVRPDPPPSASSTDRAAPAPVTPDPAPAAAPLPPVPPRAPATMPSAPPAPPAGVAASAPTPAPAAAASSPAVPIDEQREAPRGIDAGVSPVAKPVPADRDHRPAPPPRRPTRAKSKEEIGESRI
jgi:serine/threonine-protein kinase